MITQSNRPLALFSRKLSETQQNYSVTKIQLLAIAETLKEFKGMLWGLKLVVYMDHKNLMQDALGLTSDPVYRWRWILKEYGPEIIYIKGKHNTVADAISRLNYSPTLPLSKKEEHQCWMTITKCWCEQSHDDSNSAPKNSMNSLFANRSEKEEIYPLTVKEIAEAQRKDKAIRQLKTSEKYVSWNSFPCCCLSW